jgi:hypothetical protein
MNRLLTLTFSFVASVLLIAVLAINSFDRSKDISFHRDMSKFSLSFERSTTLSSNSFRLLTARGENLYLDNKTAARLLTHIDAQSLESEKIVMDFDPPTSMGFAAPMLAADSALVYLVDGSIPAIFESALNDTLLRQCLVPVPSFYDFVSLGHGVTVVKIYDGEAAQDRLARLDLNTATFQVSEVLEKQIDGIFCVDGMMSYNRELRALIYVYFYRNEFIKLDRYLNTILKGRTIDGVSQARITVDSWKEGDGNVRTFSTPPLKVNYRISTSGNALYVVSNLKSEEEGEQEFETSFPIDIYELSTGAYLGSMQLKTPIRKKDLITFEFLVNGTTLWAIFDNQLQKFKIESNVP